MPKIEAAERREKRRKRDRYGMRESGRSVKQIQEIILRKARKAKLQDREEDENA